MNKHGICLTFLGDLMCLPRQIASVLHSGCGYDVVFDDVRYLWKDSDYIIGNLETPIAPRSGVPAHGQMTFNAPTEFLQAIRKAGVQFVSLANNHALDCGEAGLDETLENLTKVGLETTGAYENPDFSDQAFIRTINGVRIGIVCCTYGINGLDAEGLTVDREWRIDTLARGSILHRPQRHEFLRSFISKAIPESIKEFRRNLKTAYTGNPAISPIPDSIDARQIGREVDARRVAHICAKIRALVGKVDCVIVYPHVGGQYNPAPAAYQHWIVDKFVEAGADVVVCNHAHRPLPCEWQSDGRVVAYALGNFCFTPGVGYYLPNVFAEYSVVLHVKLTVGRKPEVSFNIAKSVVGSDGVARTRSVYDLYNAMPEGSEKDMLALENEAVVHCFRGGVERIKVDMEYALTPRQNS